MCLAPATRWHPRLDIELSHLSNTQIASADIDHPVGDLHRLENLLGIIPDELVMLDRFLDIILADDHLLDLVELVNSVQPTSLSPCSTRLSAVAGRPTGITNRQLRLLKYFTAVECSDRDLAGSCQEKVIARNLVGLFLAPRKICGAIERLVLDHRRYDHRRESTLNDMIESKAKHCDLEQRTGSLEDVGL